MDGTLVYFNCNHKMDEYLVRAEAAGAKILMPKTQISPEHGYFAILTDTEGNRIAVHSQN
jgi:predicted enzyme related to lactoylglutathione lyase